MSDVPSKEEGNEEEEEEVDPPLSPIVGYQINSDEENHISESSETDSETEQNLAKANAQLAKIVGASQLIPEPDTPRSKLRKRLRRRQCRKMNEEFKENTSKRQKVEMDETESVQISKNEKIPEKKPHEDSFQDSIPPGFFDDDMFKENEALEKEPSPVPPPFFGFRTAGGKEVKISEKAILQAKALFSDIDASKSDSKPTTPAKGNPISEKLPLAKPSPEIPTPVKLTIAPRSKKFKVPMKKKVPDREEIRKSVTSTTSETDTGMTQEVIDSIEALFADGEDFS